MLDTNNTRRYPRTLTEAFGPYADRTPIHVEETVAEKAARLGATVGFTAALFLLALAVASAAFSIAFKTL